MDAYNKQDYLNLLIERLGNAKKGSQVYLATMSYDIRYQGIQSVVAAIEEASRRGVKVTLFIDAFNFLVIEPERRLGVLFFNKKITKGRLTKYQDQLHQSGLVVIRLGQAHRLG